MKIKIAIYGGTDLSPELIGFTESLTEHLVIYEEVIIVSGGFDYFIEVKDGEIIRHTERKSVDRVVLETAKKCIPNNLGERFETWIPPKKNDRKNVVRFEE